MSYCFRLRFDLHGLVRIGSDHQAHALEESEHERVTLEVTEPDLHGGTRESSSVVVTGRDYATPEAAHEAGRVWTAVLQRAFASLSIGADLGGRRVTDSWQSGSAEEPSQGGGKLEQEQESVSDLRLIYDRPGLMVFEDEPWPAFVVRSSSGWAGQAPSVLTAAVSAVREAHAPLSEREQTAYELFSSSFSAVSSDARFVVLMMALER